MYLMDYIQLILEGSRPTYAFKSGGLGGRGVDPPPIKIPRPMYLSLSTSIFIYLSISLYICIYIHYYILGAQVRAHFKLAICQWAWHPLAGPSWYIGPGPKGPFD